LIVVVDGGTPQTIAVVANCDTLVNCAAALSPLMNGATVTVEGSNLKITSDTTGLSSTIAITATGSGVNALALFGPNPVAVNGVVAVDTDGDGTPDFQDDDSDDDEVPDEEQKGPATCCAPLPGKVGDPTDTG
jgi:formylmethanofuran dehydrogenase subunit D